jgi:hypothetical protein
MKSSLSLRQAGILGNDYVHNQQCKTLYEPTVDAFNKINSPIYSTISTEPTISIKGMIIVHTPQFTVFGKGITTACANRIIRVDIGASQAFDNIAKRDKSSPPKKGTYH